MNDRPVFEVNRKTKRAVAFADWLRLRYPTAKVSVTNGMNQSYLPDGEDVRDGRTLHQQFMAGVAP